MKTYKSSFKQLPTLILYSSKSLYLYTYYFILQTLDFSSKGLCTGGYFKNVITTDPEQ